ncbi:MAG: NAD(+)--dinitrogen-reductase ADP-D-ribosyltransferase [Gammaproteobacteria bacterium]|nr:NAD(+)--dinitrogen-reductase ADP-D-ribosyltransferase [Gammaproteobacteria bacterium]
MTPPSGRDSRTRHLSTNLVGIPTGLLASLAFNEHPSELHISGVREFNRSLFRYLDEAPDAAAAGRTFQDYMSVVFAIQPEKRPRDADGKRQFRASYLKLLADWGFDSNGAAGAVMKGWIESRFGMFPTFHKAPLTSFTGPDWSNYVMEKMASRYHNNSINVQLDLLYEYCQWYLRRFSADSGPQITLYRGANRMAEEHVIEEVSNREVILRLNNLSSFTSRRDIADQFGDYILEAQVPKVKLLFFNELLPRHPLQGEAEYLVIGGDYRVARHVL